MLSFTESNMKLWAKLGSRAVFGSVAAPALAEQLDRTLFIAADVAASAGFERFRTAFPDRLLNIGIAEQNMVGIAAGLAKEGFIPFAFSFSPFASLRAADQIRMCLGYMGLPVKIISLAAGLGMGINGPSHYGLEDIAFLRSVPGITILSPADATETVKALLAAAEHPGPVYIRLTGAQNQPPVYKEDYNFVIGKAIHLREGKDVAFLATGTMVHAAQKAADLLAEQGVSAGVINMHTIAPLDEAAVRQACAARLIITVEEHAVVGGLGSAVAEVLAEGGTHPPLLRIGLAAYPHAAVYEQLLQQQGLTPEGLAQRVQKALGGC